tara:strand:+ start:245 stop:454 length:210 start_codon:yes stop_codon:yes gene_type:complete
MIGILILFLNIENPLKIIPVVRGSRIQGSCVSSKDDICYWDIGGSSYCDLTNFLGQNFYYNSVKIKPFS